jgi:LysR family transcriptional regulator of gallate degradation
VELRTVDYFLAVAEQGSLRAAAQRLGVTQPALTKAIRRFEGEAGATLFDRNSRGVSLTVYGTAFLRHARNLRASLREARDDITALQAGIAGQVRLGAGPSWERMVLPEAIARFRAERPAVRVQVVGRNDDTLKTMLRTGALDFVLAATPDAPELEPDLDWRPLMADDYRVVASTRHPLRQRASLQLADLLDFPWILPSPQTHMVECLRIIFRSRTLAPPEPVIETDVVSLKLELMRDSEYLSFHATTHLGEIDPGHVLPLDVPGATWRRAAGIISRRGLEANPAAAAIIALIEQLCRRRTARGAGIAVDERHLERSGSLDRDSFIDSMEREREQ